VKIWTSSDFEFRRTVIRSRAFPGIHICVEVFNRVVDINRCIKYRSGWRLSGRLNHRCSTSPIRAITFPSNLRKSEQPLCFSHSSRFIGLRVSSANHPAACSRKRAMYLPETCSSSSRKDADILKRRRSRRLERNPFYNLESE